METYIIRVNGVEYEVEVEKKDGSGSEPARKSQGSPAKKLQPAKKAAVSGEPVVCGTAGKVWKITSKEGDTVKEGDNILIMEAMKMEIPVVAHKDGTVAKIIVAEGDSITSGQTVAYIA